jgi:predicted ArsR family transcriptional regulator
MAATNVDRILFLLKTRGPATAAALARSLRMTTMGARQHLARLAADGFVEYADERLTVGRPKRHWRLTAKAESRFPDSHAHMTVEILDAVRAAFGPRGIDKIIAVRERDTLAKYRGALRGARGLAARVRKLVELRQAEGYMAEVGAESEGEFLLIENHCPVCAAARACQGLCRSELQVFREVLPGCSVERVDHILAGARRCAYRIAPAAKPARSGS